MAFDVVPQHVLVVGASAAGLSTVEALRRRGFAGRITVLGDEIHPPYDRPPLSKQILAGVWESDRATLRPAEFVAGLDADFVLGDPAVALDSSTRTVRTESGRDISADAVVIATGAKARSLPGAEAVDGVFTLRTLDHALELQKALRPGSRLVVVGEGVLGCEIAATASTLGVEVTIAGPQAAPMAAQVGPVVSGLLGQLHTENGVALRLGTAVAGLTSANGRVDGVRLASDEVLPADIVVVAIGAAPATGWLEGSGLSIDNGVVCDSRCRAADRIYAVGDVCRWHHEDLDRSIRLENRTNATEQAAAVAGDIVGADSPYVPVPYFWTDQFNAKIQVHGVVGADAEVDVVDGDLDARRFVVRYRTDGVVTGILGWNMPKQSRLRRQEIVDSLTPSPIPTGNNL